MDSLPNELLLEVFSRLEDGEALLDGVALVCKRWHALSRDPQAWRGVRVEFGMLDWHWRGDSRAERVKREKAAMAKVRVMLHAPVLRYLGWSWDCPGPHINVPQAITLSAVRRSRAAIREIYMGGVSFMADPAWAVFYGLLWRNREHLTSLSVETPQEWEEDEEEEDMVDAAEAADDDVALDPDLALENDQNDKVAAWAEADGHDSRSLLEVLVELRCLETLRLEMQFFLPYAAEFQVKEDLLPALRSLYLQEEGPPQLMVDLVRGTAARLRHLRLPDEHQLGRFLIRAGKKPRGLPPKLLESVSHCAQLRSLAANLMHVGCVVGLRHLHSLELWLSEQEVQPKDAIRIAVLLAQHGEALAGVRRLSFQCNGGFAEEKFWEAARPAVAQLLLAVARAAHNATQVRIWLDDGFEDLVEELLGCMPLLEDVDLHWAGKNDYVKALAALPNLRRLSEITSPAKPAVITALKAARPDLEHLEQGVRLSCAWDSWGLF
ncbi:uncharacterized protein LOC117649402 [Thrips palmi]|uniref:Uncharacterized protein LOC117649402 n=1 Tax=Thrips palmi TaxID=161013 RepID=A0A6P8ZS61_THRPL|nr:uncharacterized protein LOC117649402 [Thrips palmi]XP_034248050.1 uncharacterized protein LOC117649402 [Thrips palmi]XP_034248051.1 uncharacterized protein LOC117649402 [Thrips palmi]XP_034248052.1 uncharacterized protein LOC117649402 [Thrips palmi]XP_034248053.1 uncharacterized protein LOC117649402 [Thrips palmi]XP_034248055.1 uncharacterized protein LOC117649402 [Thrips palmi]XP_034248056.1 uncharacterized protein LOC117649402 [Thrips palmi]XP_034248057.1 uncharacterized protein LOC1176